MNYEDPHANVSLPVFGIHGNHDDPAGERNLSAMDVLSTAGLINYFGKHALSGGSVGTVDLKPVLMRKGSTKVALYGLGYIRDNRLHQMFNVKDAVVWHRPGETKESSSSSWFNVMLIHQNRAAHSKNAISERYLPNWLDFVVWGHEHECLVEPTESAQGFHVSQPGSSVVTSLIEGEAKEKKICVLEVKSDPENPNGAPFWRTTPVPLRSTRPFEYEQIALAQTPELDAADARGVTAFLENRVRAMIERATVKHRERHAPNEVDMTDRLHLPLIRLRVDYSGGFSTINTQRFGQKFVGKVANPHDVLLFHKSSVKRGTRRDGGDDMMDDETDELVDDAHDHANGAMENQRRIDRLVREHLSASEGLRLLAPTDLSAALDDFVNKDEKAAIAQLCQRRLKAVQTSVNADNLHENDADALLSKIYEAVKAQMSKPSKRKPVMDEATEPEVAAEAPLATRTNRRGRASVAVDVDSEAPTQKKTPAKRRPAAAKPPRPATRPATRGDDAFDDDDIEDDSDVEVIPLSNPAPRPPRPSRAAAAVASTRVRRNAAAAKDAAEDSDDSFDVDDEVIEASDEEEVIAMPTRGKKRAAAPPTRATQRKTKATKTTTAAASRAKKTTRRTNGAAGDDSGDDVDEVVAPTRGGRSTRGTQNTQATQNTWGRTRRSTG